MRESAADRAWRKNHCKCQLEDQDDTRDCGQSTFAGGYCETHFHWMMERLEEDIEEATEKRNKLNRKIKKNKKELQTLKAAEVVET